VRNVRPSEVWDGLKQSDYWWAIPSIALLLVAQVVRALRWQYLFTAASRPPYRPVFEVTLLGQCFNNVLPARAGEVARIVALHRSAGTSRAETTSTVVVERLYDVVVLLALLFVFVPWFPHVTWLHAAAILAVDLIVVTLAAVVVLLRWASGRSSWCCGRSPVSACPSSRWNAPSRRRRASCAVPPPSATRAWQGPRSSSPRSRGSRSRSAPGC
jgi:uncharacterized protein (TIRG00374 family)